MSAKAGLLHIGEKNQRPSTAVYPPDFFPSLDQKLKLGIRSTGTDWSPSVKVFGTS